jgi:CheY-like chemotaxis protein
MEPTNVLLVDDRPENLLALEAVLDVLGLNLVRANSGQEALARCQEQDFAVILLDVMMPELDGFETAARLRGHERSRNTPIIFVTAIGVEGTHVSRGYALGAVDYLIKPFDPEGLRSKVRTLTELFQRRRELEGRLRAMVPVADRANILLVDDNLANLLANELTLAELGENIVAVSSGEEALRRLLADDFAVALLDVHMPGMDGFELARMLRESDRHRDMPIVFLSATTDAEETVTQAYSIGAVDFVFEPYKPEILQAKVRALLSLVKGAKVLERQVREVERLNRRLTESQAALRRMNEMLEQRVEERTAEVEQTRARLEHVVNVSPAVTYACVIDPARPPEEGIPPTFVSANLAELLGYEPAEVLGDATWWPRNVHPDDLPGARAAQRRLASEGRLVHEY